MPLDLLIYTWEEWEALPHSGRFYQMLKREAVWVYSGGYAGTEGARGVSSNETGR